MVTRVLVLVGVVALLAACSGGSAPTPAPAGSTSAAGGSTRPVATTARATGASPTVPGAGLPPIPTNTAGPSQAGTPGTPAPATPAGTPRALPSASPVAFVPAPWLPGDRTIYNVTARDTNQAAGTATFTLGREFDADTLSALLNIGTTQDRYVMGWTAGTLAPVSELRSIVTSQGTIDVRSEFHEGGGTIEVIDRTGTNVRRLNLPAKYYANDQLLMILRALPFKEGYRGSLVLVPSMGDPATQQAVVTVTGQETLTTPLGPVRSWRVETQYEGAATVQVMWYSVETPNYLVKYDTGRYVFTVAQRP